MLVKVFDSFGLWTNIVKRKCNKPFLMKNSLTKYFTWILAFIFISAGILKIHSPENTGDILIFIFEISYEASLSFVYSIALIEIFFGIGLFIKVLEKFAKKMVFITCLIFLIVAVLGYLDNWNLTCGCFGRFSFGKFDSLMILRNGILVWMSFWIIYGKEILMNLTVRRSIKQQ